MEKGNKDFDKIVEILLSQFEDYPEIEEITEKHKPMLEREWDATRIIYPDPESQQKIIGSAVLKTAEQDGKLPQELKPKLEGFHRFRLSQEDKVKLWHEKTDKHDNIKRGRPRKDHTVEANYWNSFRKNGYSKTKADKATAEKSGISSRAIRKTRKRYSELFQD